MTYDIWRVESKLNTNITFLVVVMRDGQKYMR